MRIRNRATLAVALLLIGIGVIPISAQDYPRAVVGPYLDVVRATLAPGNSWANLNGNYIFTPPNPEQAICIFFQNNNPTNSQTFTLAVSQTGNPRETAYAAARWIDDTVIGTASPVAASTVTSVFVRTTAAAKVAVRISGAAAAAGTPDTADVFIVFTTADACGPVASGSSSPTVIGDGAAAGQADVTTVAGLQRLATGSVVVDGTSAGQADVTAASTDNTSLQALAVKQGAVRTGADGIANTSINSPFDGALYLDTSALWQFNGTSWDRMRGSTPTGLDVSSAIAGNSQRDSDSFAAACEAVDPAAGQDLCNITLAVAPTKSLYFSTVIVSASVATQFDVLIPTSAGTTCTSGSARNLNIASAVASQATVNNTCTTDPGGIVIHRFFVAANSTIIIDLEGIIAGTAGEGVSIENVAAVTGTVEVGVKWYEQ